METLAHASEAGHERASPSEAPSLPQRRRHIRPWRGWGPQVGLPATVLLLVPPDWPRWLFMWLLAAAIYAGCKWLTWRRTPARGVPWWKHTSYLLAWPGLDAHAFLAADAPPERERPDTKEWSLAATQCLLGAGLFWGVSYWIPQDQPLLLGWVGMVGLILMLHFGAFHLLSCFWRAAGVQARPLMNAPLSSTSVSEFWGKRWNTAFRDVTHRFLFRPLIPWLGPRWAILAGFLFSGLVHDLVISLPAGGGYGLPTLFFLIQALALLAERSRAGRAIGLADGWRGWAFTMVVLSAPVWLLFHPPFVTNVIVPFLGFLGATRAG
jgi:alginate O-acetyltransferase complex protein AlgI